MTFKATTEAEVRRVAEKLLGPLLAEVLADVRAELAEVIRAQYKAVENEKAFRKELKSAIQRIDRQALQLRAVQKNILKRMVDLENRS